VSSPSVNKLSRVRMLDTETVGHPFRYNAITKHCPIERYEKKHESSVS